MSRSSPTICLISPFNECPCLLVLVHFSFGSCAWCVIVVAPLTSTPLRLLAVLSPFRNLLSGFFGRFRLGTPNTWETLPTTSLAPRSVSVSAPPPFIGHEPSMTSLPVRGIAHERCHMPQIAVYQTL